MMLSTSTIKKSKDQLATMRRAGRVVAEMHSDVRAAIRPGITTAELDQVARAVLERRLIACGTVLPGGRSM